ncbi:MAG TPA: hypothetical protein VK157_16150 [Phycisphaerales bacterium]|nr:hypothetical protein [Phycisphaerales bacterium]
MLASLVRSTLALSLAAGAIATVTVPAVSHAQPAAKAEANNSVDLPIRKITLYRSGVASFERTGNVTGDGIASLRFRTEQINDILKSLVVLDLSGGSIDGVNYASQEPLAKRLSSFGIDISDSPTLQQILARLRGSRLTVQTADKTVTGTILGGETRPEAVGDATQLVSVPYVTLITEQGIVAVNLNTARGIKLEDDKLNAELMKALAAVAEYREDRTKTVDIRFSGVGTRNVQTTYVHEAPVWKTSYRLVLPDTKEDAKQDKPLMQGWAIVENTTDNDWNDVELSLVSGRPASFQMNLYDPIFTTRPMLSVPVPKTLVGQVYDEGSETEYGRALAASSRDNKLDVSRMRIAAKPAAPTAGSPRGVAESAVGADFATDLFDASGVPGASMYAAASAITSAAAGLQTGEVFFFRLSRPVTIERQRSAMLPIVSQAIEGRRVSIIGVNDVGPNPMRGVQMTNDTGLQLIAGPVSIFDGDAYAGDAQIGDTSKGDKRLLSYSVDQDVLFTREDNPQQQITKLRIVNGLLESSIVWRNVTKVTIDNKDEDKPRTMITEVAKLGGAQLVDTATKPVETTANLYRFETAVAAKSKAELLVTQERTEVSTAYLMNYNIDQLMAYRASGTKLSDNLLNAFRRAQELQGAINNANNTVSELENRRNEITRDQDRIRQNMNSIDRNSDYYARLIKKLSEQETQVETIDADLKTARENVTKAEQALTNYLSTLNME